MKSKNILILLLTMLFIVLLIEAFLFLSGSKILQSELIISPGEPYPDKRTIDIFGDYHAKNSKSLICKFFNGRKSVYREFDYSPINLKGLDSCPSYLKPKQ